MHLYPLDVAGAAGIFAGFGMIIFLFFIWALVEGLVIFLFKVTSFWRAVGQAALVNLISFIVGFVLFGMMKNSPLADRLELSGETNSLPAWMVFCVLTILIEGIVLKLLNRSRPASKIFLVSAVMNLLTYIIMFLVAQGSYN